MKTKEQPIVAPPTNHVLVTSGTVQCNDMYFVNSLQKWFFVPQHWVGKKTGEVIYTIARNKGF